MLIFNFNKRMPCAAIDRNRIGSKFRRTIGGLPPRKKAQDKDNDNHKTASSENENIRDDNNSRERQEICDEINNSPGPTDPCNRNTEIAITTSPINEYGDANNKCKICGDISNETHYGVTTCVACVAFFRKTIMDKKSYTCLVNRNCEVNKENRRISCHFCRFQKCLRKGMRSEGE